MQHKISDVGQTNLSRPLSKEEVADALAGICRTSSLSSDGLSRDFFENFWDMIKADLVDGLKESWDVGCLPTQFQEGMIFLIPKVQGVITDARQWRAITFSRIFRASGLDWEGLLGPRRLSVQ